MCAPVGRRRWPLPGPVCSVTALGLLYFQLHPVACWTSGLGASPPVNIALHSLGGTTNLNMLDSVSIVTHLGFAQR